MASTNERTVAVALSPNSYADIGKAALVDTYAPSLSFAKYRSAQFSHSVDRGQIVEESNDAAAAAKILGGVYGASGSIEGGFRNDTATKVLLESMMGTPASYVYTLTQVPKPMAILVKDEQGRAGSGASVYYDGCGISSCEITLNVKDYVKCKWSWIGRRGITVLSAATDPSFTETDLSVFYNAVVKFGTAGSEETIYLKGLTITIDRKFDQDYFFIGSQFLQGLYMNGLTTLGGNFGLGAGEWALLNQTINGTPATAGGLDVGNQEFAGDLVNAFAQGQLIINLVNSDVTEKIADITVASCNIVNMNASVQGRQMWEKTVSWQGALASAGDFEIDLTGGAIT